MFDDQSPLERLTRYEAKYGTHLPELLASQELQRVIEDGFCIIPDFWSSRKCQQAVQEIEKLLEREAELGVKVWRDDIGADIRIMGSNNLSPNLDLINDPKVQDWMHTLYDVNSLVGFTMSAKIQALKGNKGSGYGWHRDSCIPFQFKAILYLSDVSAEEGPFQYIKKSGNRDEMARFCAQHNIDLDANRLDEYEQYFDMSKLVELIASAGTLIIVNTRGIHRGKPLTKGTRYALTNYYWPPESKIPAHIKPYVN
ncbi:hypothetical protein DRW07_16880 [Alteromonas sediminis]|uniref:Phytanoyl-CoA dioxygenase n=1 Tax=Alteromonas sediminis TaxID=2259342 RepID=A0A3N5Z4K9_9ALTE|nr:phytanoyl-CoA dioxygenase family protein [Alteromonas sediminis]RPJ64994.1 hypothetical protein DRW07_16880 [Alteromonas sediminis]